MNKYKYSIVWLLIILLVGCNTTYNEVMSTGQATDDNIATMTPSTNQIEMTSTTSAMPNNEEQTISNGELLNNPDVRQALILAIDKSAIVNEQLNDGSVCTSLTMPFTYRSYFATLSKTYESSFDKAKAIEYWQRARQKLQFDRANLVLACSDDIYSQRVAKAVKLQLMSVLPHLSIRVDVYSDDDLNSVLLNGQFDLLINSFTPSLFNNIDIATLYGEPIFFKGQRMLKRFGIKGENQSGFGIDYYAQVITPFLHQQQSTVNIPVSGGINTLDPQLVNNRTALTVLGNVGEGLVALNDNRVTAAGAVDWSISEDQKIYDFYLEPNALWSNKVAVTAHDYVYGWSRFALDETTILNQLMHYAHVANYQAIDDYTLRVELSEPSEDFLTLLSLPYFYPVNQTFAEAKGDSYGISEDLVLYNGPYMVSEWQKGERISLIKSSTYWKSDRVFNDGVNFIIENDVKWQIENFENFVVDYCELVGDYQEAYAYHPHLTEQATSTLYYLSMGRQKNRN